MVYTTHGGFGLHLMRLEEYLGEKSAQKANTWMANGSLWCQPKAWSVVLALDQTCLCKAQEVMPYAISEEDKGKLHGAECLGMMDHIGSRMVPMDTQWLIVALLIVHIGLSWRN